MDEDGESYEIQNDPHGLRYEESITAYILEFFLRSFIAFDLKVDYKMENPFDDIVIKTGNSKENIMTMQLKHSKNSEIPKFTGQLRHLCKRLRERNLKENPLKSPVLCTNNTHYKGILKPNNKENILLHNPEIIVPHLFEKEYINGIFPDIEWQDLFRSLDVFITKDIPAIKNEMKRVLKLHYDGPVAKKLFKKLMTVHGKIFDDLNDNNEAKSYTNKKLMKLERKIIQRYLRRVWYKTKKPVENFVGMVEILNAMEDNGNLIILTGSEGVGKTELALQLAKDFFHWIFIKDEEDCGHEESIRRLAFGCLGIRPRDLNGNEKELHVLVKEVSDWFPIDNKDKKTIFVLDDCNPGILDLAKILAERHKVIITSREENWNHGYRITINGFTREEAKRYIREHWHESNNETLDDSLNMFSQTPGKIRKFWSEFEFIRPVMLEIEKSYSLEKYLQDKMVN